ncbi:MAG TPA: hypothetical protein VLZ50_04320 [Terracidiphilus sp.]|nr:hypothetical protein [Terracidiphilus sp.]
MCRRWFLFLLGLWCTCPLLADAPAFDLTGPKVDVHVKRGDITLPIGQVPNLLPGDRLWIHPDLPESQSAHFVLVVAFLRGITNPPPPEWFTRVETWSRTAREGVFVTVPAEAQQALVFLAPETGGDFSTLRAAVRTRPGAFVRAAQDLQAASWDRMRLNAYLAEVRSNSAADPKLLQERAEKAAKTLGIRLDKECFDKPTDQQAPCLTQHTDGLVLDDANTQGMITQLANGAAGDLMNQLSYSPSAGAGIYSAYVGAVLDTVRILSSLHTAHFQYIPALALPHKDTLNLHLNFPPSFRDPKSVIVVALPPVGPALPPPLHLDDPMDSYCVQKPGVALEAEGAPLVFATQIAHSLTLVVDTRLGPVNIPVSADAAAGGFVFDRPAPALPGGEMTGVLRGKWGFDEWEGPHFKLHAPEPGKWSLAPSDQLALIVGREDTLHLQGDSCLCVERVDEKNAAGDPVKLTWKAAKPQTLEVSMPMKDVSPGNFTIEVHQYGLANPDTLSLQAYAEAASLSRLTLSAGDSAAELTGKRLDEVERATLNGITFVPAGLKRVEDVDELAMKAGDSTAGLEREKSYVAQVKLRDGRQIKVPVTVEPPRPQVTLLSKGVQDQAQEEASPVHLGSPDDLPLEGRLVFFLKSRVPANFPRDEKIEVAADDSSFHTLLSLTEGSLMLEDSATALGVVDPQARFGSSAFGPVRVRPISAQGVAGDWVELGTLVRVPGFGVLRCPRSVAKPCTLSGSNLFLARAFSATSDFDNAIDVPPEFTGTQLTVPHPAGGVLYLKLRDDPGTVQTLNLTPTFPPMNTPTPQALAAPLKPAPATPAPAHATPGAPAVTQTVSEPSKSPAPQTAPQATPAEPAKPVPAPQAVPADPARPAPAGSGPEAPQTGLNSPAPRPQP